MLEESLDLVKIPGDAFTDSMITAKLKANKGFDFGIELPYVHKNAILISPGTWNKYFYTGQVINKAHSQTDWNEKTIRNLYLDHEEGASEWVGYVSNPRCVNGTEYGDLEIYDPITAVKLAKGKPKFGISPRVRGRAEEGIMKEFTFENFSFVINPAVKTTYINNMEVKTMDVVLQDESEVETPEPEESTEDVADEELAKKKKKEEEELAKKKKEEEEEEMAKKKKKPDYPEEELSEWTDKIKKWCKEHPGKGVQDAIKALRTKMEEEKLEEEEVRFRELLEEMAEILRKKTKKDYPDEEYPKKKKLEEMKDELAKRDILIEKLQAKTIELDLKLSEPGAKMTIKTEEPQSRVLPQYSDENFMKYLSDDVQGGVMEVQ